MFNPQLNLLSEHYLFPEITKKVEAFKAKKPSARCLNLGIGDTTLPLTPSITTYMARAVHDLGESATYHGYGPPFGLPALRDAIAKTFYEGIDPDEIVVSDGAKCDILRLMMLFEPHLEVGVQDPSYPVYIDTSIMTGKKVYTLPCREENHFFPDVTKIKPKSLIFFCTPNNPTGHTATFSQLEALVNVVLEKECFLIVDSAYGGFVQGNKAPRSIYQIDGAKKCAIEMSSFSKIAGFTGVRLGWTCVPKETNLLPKWKRIMSTTFNGASRLSQEGALGIFTPQGFQEMEQQIQFYLENSKLLKKAIPHPTYGGESCPFLWAKVAPKTSWEAFQELLESKELITTPGSGFGKEGEGYLRFSAFGKREDIIEACRRLSE